MLSVMIPMKKTLKAGRPSDLPWFKDGDAGGYRGKGHRATRWRASCCAAVAAVFALLAIFGPSLEAKKKEPLTKTVSGRVQDQAENGIDGAMVTIKDLQTGKAYSTYSQADGEYHYSDLKPNHDYEIQAAHKGISSEVRQVSSFDTRMRVTINLTIPPPQEK